MRINGIFNGLTWLLLCGMTGPAFGLSTVTGHARYERIKGRPDQGHNEIYEWGAWLGANGASENQSRRTGAPPNAPITSDGYYSFSVAPGVYSLLVHQPEHYVRPSIHPNLLLVDGQTLILHPTPPTEYSVAFGEKSGDWGDEPNDWGSTFHQIFRATGTSITQVQFKIAGTNTRNIRVSIHVDNGNANPETWPEIASRIKYGAIDRDNSWVGWLSGEVPTTPGVRYAIRLHDAAGDNTMGLYVHRDILGPGYGEGTAWKDGAAQPYDLYMIVSGDNDGLLFAYGKRAQRKPGGETQWAYRWGQTWRAKGRSLASMELFAAGESWDIRGRVRVHENGPGGAQVGPDKIANTANWSANAGLFGVCYSPGEVELVPGQTYYIEVAAQTPSTGFVPVRFELAEDNYANGNAFRDGLPQAGVDLEMTIFEYAESAPLPTPTPTPDPGSGANLLFNGDLEQGQTGEGDTFAPDSWTNWEARSETTHWYVSGIGRNGSRGARVIGGSINGSRVQGGIVQRVTGLSSAAEYRLSGWANSTHITGISQGSYIGFDPTGQDSNGLATTIEWIPLASQASTWQQAVSRSIRPQTDAISVWSRAQNDVIDGVFLTDFDDFQLVRYIMATPTPVLTPTPAATPSPSPTPYAVNETSYLILFEMSDNWFNESDFTYGLDRDGSGRVDDLDLLDILGEILSRD